MNEELLEDYRNESLAILSDFENSILLLEKDPQNKSLIDDLFRAMHTLKGTAGMYGFMFIEELTHHLENTFDNLRNNGHFDPEIIRLSLRSVDNTRMGIYRY